MMATKLYRNDGKTTLNVLGVGVLKPGEQVSVSGEYLPVVILSNYPGLVDLTDVDTSGEAVQVHVNPQPIAPKEAQSE